MLSYPKFPFFNVKENRNIGKFSSMTAVNTPQANETAAFVLRSRENSVQMAEIHTAFLTILRKHMAHTHFIAENFTEFLICCGRQHRIPN